MRSTAPASAAVREEARTEDGLGLARDEGGEQLRQAFRRVLAIAVDEGDVVEAVFDGVPVAEFLVAAVHLVERCA